VVDDGSFRKPKDGDSRVCYSVLSYDRRAEGGLQVEFIRVPYDVEPAAKGIEATGMQDEFAEMLRTGTG
jgi:hypothetical protein